MRYSTYDTVAWFYDALSFIVFKSSQLKSQEWTLEHVLPNSVVLIAGGGTGLILEALCNKIPKSLRIVYVELSEKMMIKAKMRDVRQNEVIFILGAVEMLSFAERVDVIQTGFLFDNFTQEHATLVFEKLNSILKENGLWLFTDFTSGKTWWQKLLLSCMYLFFRLLCRIEAKQVPDIKTLYINNNYRMRDKKSYFNDFIESTIYLKNRSVGNKGTA